MTEPTDLCVRCKYDLRGIANDQPCPECGLLAERSRHLGERLRDTDPVYLRRLSIGVWLLICVPALSIVHGFLLVVMRMSMTFGYSAHLEPLGLTTISLLFVLGIWWMTSTDTRRDGRLLRWIVRWLSLAPLLCLLAVHSQIALSEALVTSPVGEEIWEAVDAVTLVLIWVWLLAFPATFFLHLRSIARRLLNSHMMEHSVIVGLGTSATAAAILLTSLIASYGAALGIPEPHRNAHWPIVLLATLMALVGLFAIWIVYLLIRFAVAFIIESRALRKLWREADRSNVTSSPG